jgi:hypothetical protein
MWWIQVKKGWVKKFTGIHFYPEDQYLFFVIIDTNEVFGGGVREL